MTIAGDFDGAAKNLKDEAEPLFYRLHETIYSMITLQGKVAAEEYESALSDYSSIFMIMIVTISSGVLLACVLGNILLRGIVKPLHDAIANAVAAGDLSTKIEPHSTVNGFGRLINALKAMNDNLIDLVGKVRMDANLIQTSAGDIAGQFGLKSAN